MKRILRNLGIGLAVSIGSAAMAQSTVTFWHIYDSGDALDHV